MRNFHSAALLASIALAIVPAKAAAPGIDVAGDQFRIGIVGFVPVICRASVEASLVSQPGTASLGTLSEFCNSPNGYRVVADYSPELASGKLVIDGNAVDLGEGGSIVVSQSDHAAIAEHALSLEVPEGTSNGTLQFRIEPL